MMPGDLVSFSLSKQPPWQMYLALVIGMTLVTAVGLYPFSGLNLSIISLLYMLCVLGAAFFLRFYHALLTAVAAVLLMNYCFIEPRYTLRIASLQSWVMLTVFTILALTVSRLMQRLKIQTLQAQRAAQQSAFFQSLAELLATQSNVDSLLTAACEHVRRVFGWRVSVLQLSESQVLKTLAGAAVNGLEASSVQWALDYQRAIGAGTPDWPTMEVCLLPFGFPQREILVVATGTDAPDLHFLQLLTHQLALATTNVRQQLALALAARDASEAQFKKTLLTALSHDMRTPLTAIVGAVNVLADRQIELAPSQSAQLLHSIQAEASYLTQATENILTLVKLDAGGSSLHLDWQSPQEVIQHVVQRYLQRTPAVALQLSLPAHDLSQEVLIHVDAVLVAHALANLIDNALHWRSPDTPVEVAMEVAPPWLVLSVRNQGPGFPPGFVISAFDSHKQASAGGRGFGLGLTIVQTLMQLHQGQLALTTSDDQRTCVRLLFPFVRATDLMQGQHP